MRERPNELGGGPAHVLNKFCRRSSNVAQAERAEKLVSQPAEISTVFLSNSEQGRLRRGERIRLGSETGTRSTKPHAVGLSHAIKASARCSGPERAFATPARTGQGELPALARTIESVLSTSSGTGRR
jgi:hypothetical protein